jgi:hypothetical protein
MPVARRAPFQPPTTTAIPISEKVTRYERHRSEERQRVEPSFFPSGRGGR